MSPGCWWASADRDSPRVPREEHMTKPPRIDKTLSVNAVTVDLMLIAVDRWR
jgi:hypothetical protein